MAKIEKYKTRPMQQLGGITYYAELAIDAEANPAEAGDVYDVMALPVGAVVTRSYIIVTEVGTGTVDFGGESTPAGLVGAVDLTVEGITVGAGSLIDANAHTVDGNYVERPLIVTPSGALSSGKFTLLVEYIVAETLTA